METALIVSKVFLFEVLETKHNFLRNIGHECLNVFDVSGKSKKDVSEKA